MNKDTEFLLIVEGPDGVGKTTFCRQLAALLIDLGVDVTLVKEPMDRACITADDPIAAFAKDRAKLFADVTLYELAAGKLVISDRSVYSSIAYQGQGDSIKTYAVLDANTRTGLLQTLSQLWRQGQVATVVLLPSAGFRAPADAVDANDVDVELDAKVRHVYRAMTSEGLLVANPEKDYLDRIVIQDAIVLDDRHAEGRWALGVAIIAKALLAQRRPGR